MGEWAWGDLLFSRSLQKAEEKAVLSEKRAECQHERLPARPSGFFTTEPSGKPYINIIQKQLLKDFVGCNSVSNAICIVPSCFAKSLQSCLTLCDPIDGSPPGSPVPRILQARTLEWVAISFSNAWKWKVKVKSLSRVWLLAIPWTAAHQAPLPMGFSRQEYWSGVPLPSPSIMLYVCVNEKALLK